LSQWREKIKMAAIQQEGNMFRLGLIINPVAGIGGAVGLKGSDGMVAEALARGAVPKARERARQALLPLCELTTSFELLTMRSLTFRPSNISFSCTRIFLMIERRFR
jgi:hypothetical protein